MEAVSIQGLHSELSVECLNSVILGTFVQIGRDGLR